ncbi:MAG: OsmC family protein [Anaerolineales bacterium]|nr:OsmC family protein [Anaerolineales bacterium]
MGKKSALVTWMNGGKFVGTDSGQHSVVLSTREEEQHVGMSPSELVLVAVASCTAVDVVNILQKKRLHLEALEIAAEGEQAQDPPWPYEHIHLTYRLKGNDLTEDAVEKAIELSESRYCSVSASLKPQVKITTSFEILS